MIETKPQSGADVLVLNFSGTRFAIPASQIQYFDTAHGTDIQKDCVQKDLSISLGVDSPQGNGSSKSTPRYLVVTVDSKQIWFRVKADLIITHLDEKHFFKLPKILRESGCEQWVRGIALLGSEETNNTTISKPAIWIDLKVLGENLLKAELKGRVQ